MINLVWTFILKVFSIYFIFLPANKMEQCTPKRGNSFCDRWKKRLMNDYTIFCHEIRNTTLSFIQVGFIKSNRRKPRVLWVFFFIFPHRMNTKPVWRCLRGNHRIYCLRRSHLSTSKSDLETRSVGGLFSSSLR